MSAKICKNICKIGVILIAATLLLTSCSLVKRRDRFGSSRDAQQPPPVAAAPSEMDHLRRENASLRDDNKQALERMETLAKQVNSERAEQRRFRDMMATNFDLLEQSVALSLAKSAGSKPIVQPDELKLPPAPEPQRVSAAETTPVFSPKASVPAMAPRSVPPAAKPSPDARAAGADRNTGALSPASMDTMGQSGLNKPAQAVRRVAMTTGAGAMGAAINSQTMDDPDLVVPENPRTLKSHSAAKALYEQGFRHFARKEFAQTILVYEDFLERYPEDIYSDNAQFWIGEAYFRQNRLPEAEMAYRQVLRNYEHRSTLEGYKTPDAIYRIGQTYLKRNDSQRARYYFAAAAERFSSTSAGRKAQHELAALVLKTAGSDSGASPGS